jgi:hypothetical protein
VGPLGLVDGESSLRDSGEWSADFEQGPAVALGFVAAIELFYIYRTSWESAVEAAEARNAMDEQRG